MACDISPVAMFNFCFQNIFPWNLKIAKPVFNDFAEFVNNRVTKPSLDPAEQNLYFHSENIWLFPITSSRNKGLTFFGRFSGSAPSSASPVSV